jgi:hypothetical protein
MAWYVFKRRENINGADFSFQGGTLLVWIYSSHLVDVDSIVDVTEIMFPLSSGKKLIS